jgi:hypothetical protein
MRPSCLQFYSQYPLRNTCISPKYNPAASSSNSSGYHKGAKSRNPGHSCRLVYVKFMEDKSAGYCWSIVIYSHLKQKGFQSAVIRLALSVSPSVYTGTAE